MSIDPGGEPQNIRSAIEGCHELEVQEQAARVQIGRTAQGELVVDDCELDVEGVNTAGQDQRCRLRREETRQLVVMCSQVRGLRCSNEAFRGNLLR